MKRTVKLTYLSLCLAILTLNSFSAVLEAPPSDINSGIDQFIQKIQNTADDCWRKPANNRRNAIINKLTALQELVWEENFAEAYDKLLRDIKPKLTALKTDENEESWGSGVFKEAWVTCSELREEFRMECNRLLSYLKAGPPEPEPPEPEPPPDDDTEPPVITIIYDGDGTTENPGVWNVDVSDAGSGLAEVKISVDGAVFIHVQGLGGIITKSYTIPVPATIGVHIIEVFATDNDNDWPGDQQEITITDSIEIVPPPPILG